MLEEPAQNQDTAATQGSAPGEELSGPVREARVARTRSGTDHHNTLTPVWEFPFSV
ncbi:MAG: hypothetical protein H7039_07655 [Bryobacteraceae bacterium]|nr:hypothetical protein [Bryobacteraceae bacterium]